VSLFNSKIKICQNSRFAQRTTRKTFSVDFQNYDTKLSTTLSKYIGSSVFKSVERLRLDDTRPHWNPISASEDFGDKIFLHVLRMEWKEKKDLNGQTKKRERMLNENGEKIL